MTKRITLPLSMQATALPLITHAAICNAYSAGEQLGASLIDQMKTGYIHPDEFFLAIRPMLPKDLGILTATTLRGALRMLQKQFEEKPA